MLRPSGRQLAGGLHYNRVEAPNELVEAPAYLPEDVRDEFIQIVQDLEQLKPGLSTRADRIMLIGFARAMALRSALSVQLENRGMHTRTLHGELKMSPYLSAYLKTDQLVMRYCTHFGLSPYSRARLPAPPTGRPRSAEETEVEALFD